MLIRSRLRFLLLTSAALGATAFACGGISDPTRGGEGNVATVSGALTGTSVPANARVALIWHKVTAPSPGSGVSVEVGSDVPVVDGKFTMNLAVPAADYFSNVDGHSLNSVASPPPQVGMATPVPDSPPSAGSGGASSSGGAKSPGAANIHPRDIVGGSITEPLSAAIAGFVVYVDTNGNGKLDLEGEYASSPDQVIGGNKELILAYLKNGGALDYEKLRDKSGILPAAGFNLAWSEGRWLPLTVVELKLSEKPQLPSAVCESSGSSGGSSGTFEDPAPPRTETGGTSGGTGGYPSSSDPGLHCSPDGRSFTYTSGATCPPPPPPRVGLCAGDYGDVTYPCASAGYQQSIPAGEPAPSGWPCDVAPDLDGGPAPDSGINDAGAGPG